MLNGWKDPHNEVAYTATQSMSSIDIGQDGHVQMVIQPARPHCPCCLLDLRNLQQKTISLKGVTDATITVTGVPAAERWTREVNA
jgi:metal-sulfur cluster biosynthetic enzyme